MRMVSLVAHHHLAELVEVHRSGSVLVNLLDDAVQVLLGQSRVQLGDDFSKLAWNRDGDLVGITYKISTTIVRDYLSH